MGGSTAHPGGATRDAVVESGVLVVGAGALFGLDPATGAVRWRFAPLGNFVAGGFLLSAANGLVYAGSSGGPGLLYGVDVQTGRARWTATLPLTVGPGETVAVYDPVFAGGRVYASYTHFRRDSNTGRALDGRGGAVAVDAATGAVVWHYPFPSPNGLSTSADVGLAADSTTVLATAIDKSVRALDPATGQVRWSVPGVSPTGTYSLGFRPVALGAGLAAVGDPDGGVTLYRAADGSRLWYQNVQLGSALSLAVDARDVYLTTLGGQLSAESAAGGSTAWAFRDAASFLPPPRPAGDVLYATGGQGLAAIRAR